MTALAYLVHAYTAAGVVCGLLSLVATVEGDYRQALFWLLGATAIDASDGWIARLVRVEVNAPLINGARLDDVVDYVTYVLVPGFLLLHAGRLPDGWMGIAVICAMLVSSALGFSRVDAKTADHYFTGFPSYWNVVAVYVLAGDLPRGITAITLVVLSVLVLVPIRYVYPTRTPVLWPVTVIGGAVWGLQVALMIWWLPTVPAWLLWSSAVFLVYYTGLSFWLNARRLD
jgi:phosphatidylcholine synthase